MAGDYMMRMIEQVAAMLASIIAKRAAGKVAEARVELEHAPIEMVGIPLRRLKQLSPEAVRELLGRSGGLRHLHAVKLAELLLLEAEWQAGAEAQAEALKNKVHAFCLLADSVGALSADEEGFFRQKLNVIAQELGDLRNHPYIRERLAAQRSSGHENQP